MASCISLYLCNRCLPSPSAKWLNKGPQILPNSCLHANSRWLQARTSQSRVPWDRICSPLAEHYSMHHSLHVCQAQLHAPPSHPSQALRHLSLCGWHAGVGGVGSHREPGTWRFGDAGSGAAAHQAVRGHLHQRRARVVSVCWGRPRGY